jgi:hypothetical protein
MSSGAWSLLTPRQRRRWLGSSMPACGAFLYIVAIDSQTQTQVPVMPILAFSTLSPNAAHTPEGFTPLPLQTEHPFAPENTSFQTLNIMREQGGQENHAAV